MKQSGWKKKQIKKKRKIGCSLCTIRQTIYRDDIDVTIDQQHSFSATKH